MSKQVVFSLDDDDVDDDMETNAEDVANERDSIKIKLNFNQCRTKETPLNQLPK
jgi:hypothetical protein